MSGRPLVSLLVPTYGRADLLALTLRSAMDQTWDELEIVVADDCSPDHTEEVVRELAREDERIRYVRQPHNLGNFGNSRFLLHEARGDYLKLLLDDDLLMPRHVEALVEPMVDDPGITLAFSQRVVIDEHGVQQANPVGVTALSANRGPIEGDELIQLCLCTLVNWIGEQTTVMYPRRRMVPSLPCTVAGSGATHVLADLAMWLNLLAKGRAYYTPEPLSAFRKHGGQVTNRPSIPVLSFRDWEAFVERVHLFSRPISREQLLVNIATLTGGTANAIAAIPDLPEGPESVERLPQLATWFGRVHRGEPVPARLRVAVVVVGQDDAGALLALLESLIGATPSDAVELVLVSDGASAEVRGLIASVEGEVRVVEHEARLGTGRSWAAATDVTDADTVVFLDDRVRPARGWLGPLLDCIAADDVAAAAPALVEEPSGRALQLGWDEAETGESDELRARGFDAAAAGFDVADVACGPGGIVAARRDVLRAVLPEVTALDAPAAERELCGAIRAAGWRVQVNPGSWAHPAG